MVRVASILAVVCLLVITGCASSGQNNAEVASFATELLALEQTIQYNYEKATACLDEWSSLHNRIDAGFEEFLDSLGEYEFWETNWDFATKRKGHLDEVAWLYWQEQKQLEWDIAGDKHYFTSGEWEQYQGAMAELENLTYERFASVLEQLAHETAQHIYENFNELHAQVVGLACPGQLLTVKEQFIEANEVYLGAVVLLSTYSLLDRDFSFSTTRIRGQFDLFLAYRVMAIDQWNELLPHYNIQEISEESFQRDPWISPNDPAYVELLQDYERQMAALGEEYQTKQAEVEADLQEALAASPGYLGQREYEPFALRRIENSKWYDDRQKEIEVWFEQSKWEIAGGSLVP